MACRSGKYVWFFFARRIYHKASSLQESFGKMAEFRDHLRWADMASEAGTPPVPPPPPRFIDVGTQTEAPALIRDWPDYMLAHLCSRYRPRLPHHLRVEVSSYIGWILEMLARPCTTQLHQLLQAWKFEIRARLWHYRLRYTQALAVFGITF